MKKNILLACFIVLSIVTTGFLYMGLKVSTDRDQYIFTAIVSFGGYLGSLVYFIGYRSHIKSSN